MSHVGERLGDLVLSGTNKQWNSSTASTAIVSLESEGAGCIHTFSCPASHAKQGTPGSPTSSYCHVQSWQGRGFASTALSCNIIINFMAFAREGLLSPIFKPWRSGEPAAQSPVLQANVYSSSKMWLGLVQIPQRQELGIWQIPTQKSWGRKG
ncbi:hypothetical protein J6590_072339 [Homalodisca vitripennis]|nr:hypothetical protein J6590_072339 [Homalodisca vitripennis]